MSLCTTLPFTVTTLTEIRNSLKQNLEKIGEIRKEDTWKKDCDVICIENYMKLALDSLEDLLYTLTGEVR